MMGGNTIGLLTFVEQRVANVKQQLDGTLPSKGDGSGMGNTGRGGLQGQAGAIPGQPGGAVPGQGRQRQQGQAPQGGFQAPPDGFQPPAVDGAQAPRGEFGGRGGFPPGEAPDSASPASTFGVQPDQVVPVGVAVLLLLGATGLVWRLRPR